MAFGAVLVAVIVGAGFWDGLVASKAAGESYSSLPEALTTHAPAVVTPPISLPTGTDLRVPEISLLGGSLRVNNGTSADAVVRLVQESTGSVLRAVYIRAGEVHEILYLPETRMKLQFTLGRNWSQAERRFLEDALYSEFDEILDYEHSPNGGSGYDHRYEASLHPVLHGTAHVTRTEAWDGLEGEQPRQALR